MDTKRTLRLLGVFAIFWILWELLNNLARALRPDLVP